MYLDLVEELLLERQNYLYVKPEYRLLYCVLTSAYIVHSQHVMLEKMSQTEEGKQMIQDMANKISSKEIKTDIPQLDLGNNPIPSKQMDISFEEKYNDLMI
jgi:hypothetical protein